MVKRRDRCSASLTATTTRVALGAAVIGAGGLGMHAIRRHGWWKRRGLGTHPVGPPPEPHAALRFPEADAAAAALRVLGTSVAVAESCTGGLLGAALTSVPGSSAYMRGGVIAYADDVKRDLLGVPAAVLEIEGAVSETCAVAMAQGVRRLLHADIGVAITGIAGPGADRSTKPVGLIFVCVAAGEAVCRVEVTRGDRGRDANREGAVRTALRLLALAAGSCGAGSA